ncbi:MAG: helix-turn-helix transcriptional regulator [Thalassolituus sp.]|uniref:helix-turn-helix transcriptional regulator n=1 Tax=Thalassolituus sp. TaxID=2030822 RepID=UPI003981B40E
MEKDSVLEAIYSSALKPEQWLETLEIINRYLDSSHIFIAERSSISESPISFVESGFESGHFETYQQHFFTVDLWSHALIPKKHNEFHASHNVVDDKVFEQSEIYQDFARPAGVRNGIGCILTDNFSGIHAEIGVMRDASRGRYNDTDVHRANSLIPHINSALKLSREYRRINAQATALSSILDQSRDAFALFTLEGKILYHNALWEQWLAKTRIAKTVNNSLYWQIPNLQNQFHKALNQYKNSDGQLVNYFIQDAGKLLNLQMKPTRHEFSSAVGHHSIAAALVTIISCGNGTGPDTTAMKMMYRMTQAEAEVVALLCQGITTEEISHFRGSSIGTIRQQIKSCLHKTESSNQTVMITKLLRLISY